MPNNAIKDPLVSNETLLLIPNDVLQSGVLNSGNPITQTVLSKWLREIHRIYVTALPSYADNTDDKIHYFEISYKHKLEFSEGENSYFDSYEKALEAGLQKALKRITTK